MLGLLALTLPWPLRAAVTNHVFSPLDGGADTLRQAILDQNSAGGGVILISAPGPILLRGELPEIIGNTVIEAEGEERFTVDGNGLSRVLAIGSNATVVLRRLRITRGTATNAPGGGAILNRGNLTLIDCLLDGNRASTGLAQSGGAIHSSGNLTLISSSVISNRSEGFAAANSFSGGSSFGGGLFASGTLRITNSTIGWNTSIGGLGLNGDGSRQGGYGGTGSGGGIAVSNGHVILHACTVVSNTVRGGQGGSSLFGGQLTSGSGYGGGLHGQVSTGSLVACTFTGNRASGGFVYDAEPAYGYGGQSYFLGPLSVISCTVLHGSADVTPGMSARGVSFERTALNSVFAFNGQLRGGDRDGLRSLGYNLFQGEDQASTSTDIVNRNPLLGPLQDNGGPTWTHAPLANSPLIDAGVSIGLSSDQRGEPRVHDSAAYTNAADGDGTDIGAVEISNPSRGGPRTNLVTSLSDAGPGSLRQAILDVNDQAGGEGLILFSNLTGTILLSNALPRVQAGTTIVGPGREKLVIHGGRKTVFEGEARRISGLTIQGGLYAFLGEFEIVNCAMVDCSVAVASYRSLVLRHARIQDCGSSVGAVQTFGTAAIQQCSFVGNRISAGCSISSPGWRPGGAALLIERGRAFVGNCQFSGNIAQAISTSYPSCETTAHPARGGAIHVAGGILDLVNCTFFGNQAVGGTGTTGDDCDGGRAEGGALHIANGMLFATNCSFIGNRAQGGDAVNAVLLPSSFTVPTRGGHAAGGAVCLKGYASVTGVLANCTFSGNIARGGRGAQVVEWGGGTRPPQPGGDGEGGALCVLGGSWRLLQSTVASNHARGGDYNPGTASPGGSGWHGGISRVAGTLTIQSTLLIGNLGATNLTPSNAVTFPSDAGGAITSLGHNLIGITNGAGGWVAADRTGADPRLGPLQDNGGPVPTFALLAGSPAIDAGTNSGIALDARGQPRTVDSPGVPTPPGGDGTDIGALEVNPVLTGVAAYRVANDMFLQFTTVSDKAYRVEFRSEATSGTWTALPGLLPGTGGILTYRDTNGAILPRRFYRFVGQVP